MVDVNKPDGWKTISRNKIMNFVGDKLDIMQNEEAGTGGEITSFFFTDFDTKWRARDLFFEFKERAGQGG